MSSVFFVVVVVIVFLTDVGLAFESPFLNKEFYLLMVTRKECKMQ